MEIWSILGIESTKDKEEIKKAYRRRLAKTNPEDNPEGFMELRGAYEEALRLADGAAIEENGETDRVTEAIKELYGSFSRRIDIKEWEKLFDMDEFVSLDTSQDAFDSLMRFLMESFCIPKAIWELICNTFDIVERKKELAASYPEDFIEYVINNATYDDLINYELFEGNEEYFDRYIELYYRLDAAIRRKELESQERIISEIESLDAYHPYFDVCRIRHEIQKLLETKLIDDSFPKEEKRALVDSLIEKAKQLYEKYNRDIFIINCCGDLALFVEDYEEAKKYYDMSLLIAPDNYMVKGKQAELCFYLGEYEKSRDIYMDLLKINHYDNNVRAGMIRANQGLIDRYTKELLENPDDSRVRLEMSWSLYQSYRFDEAIASLDKITPTDENCFEYYNLKGRTFLCIDDFDNAIDCFFKWKEAIEGIPDEDTSEEAEKKRKRYEYANFLIADCYLKKKNYKDARAYLDTALKKEHDEIILSYEAMCELEYKIGDNEACIDACEKLLARDARSYIGYDFMSRAYFNMGYANEAISACEHAISIYPYVAEPYVLEAKIFTRLNRFDTAEKVIERFAEFGIESDKLDCARAYLLEAKNDIDGAISVLVKAINNGSREESDLEDYSEIFMQLGALYEKKNDSKNAMDIYERVIKNDAEHDLAYGRLGMLYRESDRLKDAIDMFTKQLQINPMAYYYIQRAILYRHFNRLDEAEEDYLEALKEEPDNSFCHLRLALIYELKGEFDKAVSGFDRALMYISDDDEQGAKKKAQILACKARACQCMCRFEESDELYKRYISEYGINADVMYDYSELLLRMNRLDEAVKVLTECINTLPYDADIQMCIRQLIYVYGTEGYLDKAHEAYKLAISKDALDARAYGSLAGIFRNRGMYSEAKKYYEKAVEISNKNSQNNNGGNNANYYMELAEIITLERTFFRHSIDAIVKKGYSRLKNMNSPFELLKLLSGKRAEKKLKEAIELADRAIGQNRCQGCFYSKCHEAFFEKGLIYESMKDYETALSCYREALRIAGYNAIYEEKIRRIENNDSRNRSRNNK